MLCKDKIISFFCLIDGVLQGIDHKGDIRRQVSNSEVILTTIILSTSFYGNNDSAIQFIKQHGFIPNVFKSLVLNYI